MQPKKASVFRSDSQSGFETFSCQRAISLSHGDEGLWWRNRRSEVEPGDAGRCVHLPTSRLIGDRIVSQFACAKAYFSRLLHTDSLFFLILSGFSEW